MIGRVVDDQFESAREYVAQHHMDFILKIASLIPAENYQKTAEEIVTALLTVLCNATLSPTCGKAIPYSVSLRLLSFLKDLEVGDNVAKIGLMCLSNLSYYYSLQNTQLDEIVVAAGPILTGVLFQCDSEASLEASRTLGNMSLIPAGRRWLETHQVDDLCIILLGHEDLRLVYNSYGVLINMSAHEDSSLYKSQEKLSLVLQRTAVHALHKAEEIRQLVDALLRNIQSNMILDDT